jgi:hypothetical protein
LLEEGGGVGKSLQVFEQTLEPVQFHRQGISSTM